MATTHANTLMTNRIKTGAIVKIVNTIPDLADAQLGEMFLLISDSDSDDKKLHVRTTNGWLKATLS